MPNWKLNLQPLDRNSDALYTLHLVKHINCNINRIIRKYCEEVGDESRMAAAQFFLDLIEMRDNFRHSGSFLSFNEVYHIIMHLATQ